MTKIISHYLIMMSSSWRLFQYYINMAEISICNIIATILKMMVSNEAAINIYWEIWPYEYSDILGLNFQLQNHSTVYYFSVIKVTVLLLYYLFICWELWCFVIDFNISIFSFSLLYWLSRCYFRHFLYYSSSIFSLAGSFLKVALAASRGDVPTLLSRSLKLIDENHLQRGLSSHIFHLRPLFIAMIFSIRHLFKLQLTIRPYCFSSTLKWKALLRLSSNDDIM